MNELVELLLRAGPRLMLGVSVLLALGMVAVWCCKEPLHRQRAAEITVASVLVWLALAFVPRPANDPPVIREQAAPAVHVAPPLERLAVLERTIEIREAQLTSLAAPVALATPIDWPRVLVLGWLGSVALGLAWLALGACALVRVLVSATNAPPRVRALVGPFSGKVLVSPRVTRAFCCSFVRDVIVLPHALVEDADHGRLAAVLDHERAHLEQRDAGGRLLFALALPLLCWHPLYWLLARQASLAAELVADEIAATRTSPECYARAMIELAAASPSRAPFLLGASPAFCGRSEFYRRMKMLLQRDRRLTVRLSPMRRIAQTGCALLAIAGASAFVGVGELRAQDAEKPAARANAEELQKEREALKREVAALRDEIAKLKKELAAETAREPVAAGGVEDQRRRYLAERLTERGEMAKAAELAQVAEKAKVDYVVRRAQAAEVAEVMEQAKVEVAQRAHAAKVAEDVAQSAATKDYLAAQEAEGVTRNTRRRADPVLVEKLAAARAAQAGAVDQRVRAELEAEVAQNPLTALARAQQQGGRRGELPVADEWRGAQRATAHTVEGDVLQLVNRAIDLDGEMALAKQRVAHLEPLVASGAASQDQLLEAQTRLKTAAKKHGVVIAALESERQACEIELNAARQRGDKESSGEARAQIVRLEGRLRAIQQAR